MTKKHYIAIAEILNKAARHSPDASAASHCIAYQLCEIFATDNPNFDDDRFLKAVFKPTRRSSQ